MCARAGGAQPRGVFLGRPEAAPVHASPALQVENLQAASTTGGSPRGRGAEIRGISQQSSPTGSEPCEQENTACRGVQQTAASIRSFSRPFCSSSACALLGIQLAKHRGDLSRLLHTYPSCDRIGLVKRRTKMPHHKLSFVTKEP
jgi:hypothetical protein